MMSGRDPVGTSVMEVGSRDHCNEGGRRWGGKSLTLLPQLWVMGPSPGALQEPPLVSGVSGGSSERHPLLVLETLRASKPQELIPAAPVGPPWRSWSPPRSLCWGV